MRAVWWLPLILCGCSLLPSGPDLQRAAGYKFQPQPQWTATEKGESDRAYRLPSGNIFSLTSSCNRHADAPLDVLTRHLLMGERNVDYLQQKKVTVDGTEALFSHIKSRFEKEPFYLMVVVLSKDSCIFDFTLLSPKTIPAKDETQFWAAINSFSYGKK
jgi:hypothetical protein